MTGKLVLLTGGRGHGKTTLCRRFADHKTSEGYCVAGLITPARMESGIKTGIVALDLRTGASQLLASNIPGEIAGVAYGDWVFDPEVFEWGNQVFQRATSAEIFLVDEIGPLEFELGIGWISAVNILVHQRYLASLTVVRPEYLTIAQKRWGVTDIFDVDSGSGDMLEVIAERLHEG